MKKLILSLLILILFTINLSAQILGISGTRIMPVNELSVRADVIVRAKVKKVEKASYLDYTQSATLQVTEIIKGDNRLKEVRVWSGTQNINANDTFNKDIEVLVFLVYEQTFYRLLNFQHGIFVVEGEAVRNWRVPIVLSPNTNGSNNPNTPNNQPDNELEYTLIDKSYQEVRREIDLVMKSIKTTGKEYLPK
ncbi:MAG: hypothetical protein WAQ98_00815 [Blastocatellia bacterium]